MDLMRISVTVAMSGLSKAGLNIGLGSLNAITVIEDGLK
jgi:hypothetical protein